MEEWHGSADRITTAGFYGCDKWWIFSNKSLLVCLGGGVIAYLLFKITAMIHLAFLGVWLGVMLEAGLFIGVTFPVPDFGSSLLAFGGRTADELIISMIAHHFCSLYLYLHCAWRRYPHMRMVRGQTGGPEYLRFRRGRT